MESLAKTRPTIHDHFFGSANCVQCGGDCQLEGSDLLATELVRWIIQEAVGCDNGRVPHFQRLSMEATGLDVDALIRKCRSANMPGRRR